MKLLAIVLLFCVVLVAAQVPHKPTWPNAFSSTVMVRSDFGHDFFRWFYDYRHNKDRLDGLMPWEGEMYWATQLFDQSTKKLTIGFFEPDFATCFIRDFDRELPHPDFSTFSFVGKAEVEYRTAYHWSGHDSARNLTIQYFESAEGRFPLRFDVFDSRRGRADIWTFHEFAEGPQNDALFSLPEAVQAVCNEV